MYGFAIMPEYSADCAVSCLVSYNHSGSAASFCNKVCMLLLQEMLKICVYVCILFMYGVGPSPSASTPYQPYALNEAQDFSYEGIMIAAWFHKINS
jgi:hypothetical protein